MHRRPRGCMKQRNWEMASKQASKQCKSRPNSTQLNVCRLKFIVYAMHTHKIHYTRLCQFLVVFIFARSIYMSNVEHFSLNHVLFTFCTFASNPFANARIVLFHFHHARLECMLVGAAVWCHANKAIKIEYPEWIKKEDSRSRAFVFRWDMHTAPFTCHKNELH